MERGSDDRAHREIRRLKLALRLMEHQARTHTISAMTKLTRHQQDTLRQRWEVTEGMRYRGPSPQSLSVFLHSAPARSEAAALGVLLQFLKVLPAKRGPRASRHIFSLDGGERLCTAFEFYRGCTPASDWEFEEVLLLAVELAKGELVDVGCCTVCGGTILIDRLADHSRRCAHCDRTEGSVDRRDAATDAEEPTGQPKASKGGASSEGRRAAYREKSRSSA